MEEEFVEVRNCGQARGTPVARTVPKLSTRGCGGLRRSCPTGGCAYGMPLNESTPRKLDPTTLADSSWTTGGNNCRFSSIGAAKVRGRRHVAKLMRDSMLTSKEDNSANDQLRLLERIWGNLARSKHIRGVRYIS